MVEPSSQLAGSETELLEALRQLRFVIDSMNERLEFVTDDEDAVILRADRALRNANARGLA